MGRMRMQTIQPTTTIRRVCSTKPLPTRKTLTPFSKSAFRISASNRDNSSGSLKSKMECLACGSSAPALVCMLRQGSLKCPLKVRTIGTTSDTLARRFVLK
uniref:Uncharacterized protein n=1 Tax=Cacopsylla melanoneura TaxID=428564 RepID=A0A8D8SK50_9HEMI